MSPRQPFSWVVDRFENGHAVLSSELGNVIVPRHLLGEDVREGDVVTAEFYLLKHEKKRRENIARALLEEILGSDEETSKP